LDESGDVTFSRGRGISQYFYATSVVIEDCKIGNDLVELRRDLAWNGISTSGEFHATTDAQVVRDAVFALIQQGIAQGGIRIDATVFEKRKTQNHLRVDPDRFYKTAFYLHLSRIWPAFARQYTEVMVVCAAYGTKKRSQIHEDGIKDIVKQLSWQIPAQYGVWPAMSDPCLQIADYCSWAIQRRWETNHKDMRSHALIAPAICSENDYFRYGNVYYY